MKKIMLLLLITLSVCLAGCATSSLTAPCPRFGEYCTKTPINSWDVNPS